MTIFKSLSSFPQKRESNDREYINGPWIPAFAGMTARNEVDQEMSIATC